MSESRASVSPVGSTVAVVDISGCPTIFQVGEVPTDNSEQSKARFKVWLDSRVPESTGLSATITHYGKLQKQVRGGTALYKVNDTVIFTVTAYPIPDSICIGCTRTPDAEWWLHDCISRSDDTGWQHKLGTIHIASITTAQSQTVRE